MKAWIKRIDGVRFEEVDEPSPGSDDLVVRVEAVSLNRGEVRTVARAADGLVPGWDVAGTVERSAASGRGPQQGERVAAIVGRGAWAERCVVPAAHAARIPSGVDAAVAATLPIAAMTALRALDIAGNLLARRVLITGGTGGVGRFAIQLAALAGAETVAVSSRREEHDGLRRLGASATVEAIEQAEGGFDLILESVGGPSLAAAIGLVAPGGVIVTIGNSAEEETTFNARTLYAKSGARVEGLLIFEELATGRLGGADLERLLSLVADARLEAPVALRRPWTELPETLRELGERRFVGKAVLTVG